MKDCKSLSRHLNRRDMITIEENAFSILERRLNRIEFLLLDIKEKEPYLPINNYKGLSKKKATNSPTNTSLTTHEKEVRDEL